MSSFQKIAECVANDEVFCKTGTGLLVVFVTTLSPSGSLYKYAI